MLVRNVLPSFAFLAMTLASPVPQQDPAVTWTVSGPKEAVKALGAPGEGLQALGKAMLAKGGPSVDNPPPAVQPREKADDLLMYYNA
ncbi:hypothetical protein Cob_v008307 [Colletotrichum orbiculare MAFF 240422]|uniref:Uncharacterized protein n=1 Tax=Colletotrichum orbiculare (strain 104-T / ATCC 96160 / CBS 514.97 / LARS 414 / MAFF 240422) TaxID=1213857 RepID=N4VZM5_COLOR|nr:hypothetical protein Cob_v008307 [Colletotrichum orbiculare MAFF 240422]